MTKETAEWLRNNVLVGFVEERGEAWWADWAGTESDHTENVGTEENPVFVKLSNHFDGPIPVAEVQKRLFNFEAVQVPVYFEVGDVGPHFQPANPILLRDADAPNTPNTLRRFESMGQYMAVVHSVTGKVFTIASDTYQPHQFGTWLVDHVGSILELSHEELGIGSAGLLKGGSLAWVQLEFPDSFVMKAGDVELAYRPHFLALTSHDQTQASQYRDSITVVVCDNTMTAAMGEKGGRRAAYRHSRNSLTRFSAEDVRARMGMLRKQGDAFQRKVSALVNTPVSDVQWGKFLDVHFPLPEAKEGPRGTKALTYRENVRSTLTRMWNTDPRVAPWHGTAFGVAQAVNTWGQHEAPIKGSNLDGGRPERRQLNAVSGKSETLDIGVLESLGHVVRLPELALS